MNPIRAIELEHEDIERELIEFETIIDSDVINYPNLVHVFKRFCKIWDEHETKEEGIFNIMNKGHLTIPVQKITTEHKYLKKHIKGIREAISSGDDYKVHKSLDEDLKALILKVREHIEIEDEILYTISPQEFNDKELKDMEEILSKFIN